MTRRTAITALLVLGVMGGVLWIRLLPLSLPDASPEERAQLTFTTADGRAHPYLPGYDSYDWLRMARNVLRSGTPCDAIPDGECRDTFTHAPIGRSMSYEHSPHVFAIAALHRIATRFQPDYPLSASAYLLPVVIALLGVWPAFAIGRRLAGPLGGFLAAALVSLNPLFLLRSATADNDVWNVVLPLFLIWFTISTATATNAWRQAAWAVAATLVAVLHALIWKGWIFGYSVALAGLAANAVLRAVHVVQHTGPAGLRAAPVRQAVRALGLFALFAAILASAAGALTSQLHGAVQLARELFGGATTPAGAAWPDAFQTVGELARPSLAQIANLTAGPVYLYGAWLGLLVLLLPQRGWRPPHFAVLIGGNYLYWYLLRGATLSRPALLAACALPLVAALVLGGDDTAPARRSAALVVIVWFLAALFLAFDGVRFVMMVTPPAGIACAVAVGRLGEWLVERLPAAYRAARVPLLMALGAAALVQPVQLAVRTASGIVPRVNDAWWDALTALRDTAPADAIVHTWWPYGYFSKYAAERRVSADGGSLPTHVPYWLARALMADDESEAAGLLRMLSCRSDVTPRLRDERGAYNRLTGRGVEPAAAQALLIELAGRDAAAARALLYQRGFREGEADDVLQASHCAAPPSYLVLSDEMARTPGWMYLASWSSRDTAGTSPREALLTPTWVPCRLEGTGRVCPLRIDLARNGVEIEAFAYPPAAPSTGRLRWRRPANQSRGEGAPAQIVLAESAGIRPAPFADAIAADLAVLVDVSKDRILVGTPRLLRSTFVQLMFLDGRYAHRFAKRDDRTGYGGERVVTWAIAWDEAAPPPAVDRTPPSRELPAPPA